MFFTCCSCCPSCNKLEGKNAFPLVNPWKVFFCSVVESCSSRRCISSNNAFAECDTRSTNVEAPLETTPSPFSNNDPTPAWSALLRSKLLHASASPAATSFATSRFRHASSRCLHVFSSLLDNASVRHSGSAVSGSFADNMWSV